MFLTNQLDFTTTIIPLALMASESIAREAFGLMGYCHSEPIRAQGIIVNQQLACNSNDGQKSYYNLVKVWKDNNNNDNYNNGLFTAFLLSSYTTVKSYKLRNYNYL